MLKSCFLFVFFVSFLFACGNSESITIDMLADVTTLFGLTYPGYSIHVDFGTPLQPLELLVDGGLDMLFLSTPNCTQPGCPIAYFFPNQSSTIQYTTQTLNYTYAAGNLNVHGYIAADNGVVGGVLDFNQELALIVQLTQPKYYPPSAPLSGVFGFSYPSPENGKLSLVQNIALQNNIPFKMSFWLPTNIYESGILTIGEPNESLYTGSLTYVPLLPSTWAGRDYPFFWSNIVEDIKVNGVSNGKCNGRRTCNFFIDLAAYPMDLGNAISPVHVNSDCSNLNDLDTYTLVIGGTDYVLTPKDYVIQYNDEKSNGTTVCESGINTTPLPIPFTLGYTFIRNYFTVFDYENQQIGFAPAALL